MSSHLHWALENAQAYGAMEVIRHYPWKEQVVVEPHFGPGSMWPACPVDVAMSGWSVLGNSFHFDEETLDHKVLFSPPHLQTDHHPTMYAKKILRQLSDTCAFPCFGCVKKIIHTLSIPYDDVLDHFKEMPGSSGIRGACDCVELTSYM